MAFHRVCIVSLTLTLTLVAGAEAQIESRIYGHIVDQSGAAVVGATVTLLNIATGTERTTTSDESGSYQFTGLSIGIYRLRVQKAGFSEISRNLEIAELGESVEVNFDLMPGGITEQVTVTATRGQRDVLNVPVRTQAITQTVLARQNPAGTGDVLLNVPSVTPVNSGPYLVRPRLRGLDSTRLLILVDGERLNNSRTSTGAAGVEVGLIDPGIIEAVEVVHGAGSALYGTDALSGTINIITQMPRTVDEAIRWGGSFTGYFSSNEPGRRGTARVDVAGRRFAVRVSGMLERFPNYSAGEPFSESNIPMIEAGVIEHKQFGPISDVFNEPFVRSSSEIPNSQEHGNNINVVGRYFFTENQSLKVSWMRRRALDIGFPDFALPYQIFETFKLPLSKLDKASLRYQVTALTTWFSRLAIGGYWQHQDRRLFNDFFVFGLSEPEPGDPPFASVARVDIQSSTGQNVKTFGYDVQANFLLGTKNVLTVGSSLFRDHNKDFRETVVSVRLVGAIGRPPLPPDFFPLDAPIVEGAVSHDLRLPISNFQNFAVFFQDEHEVSHSIRLIGSLRVDRFDIDARKTPLYNPRPPELESADPPLDLSTVPPVDGIKFNRSSITGDVGVVYHPLESVSLTARVGRSFRHPNLAELFFSGPAEAGALVPNIKLKPEKGTTLDVGVKVRTARFSGSLSYFHSWYKDFLTREQVSFSAEAGGPIFQTLNFSRVRIKGVEADWEVPIRAPKSIFSLFGNFSYLYGVVKEAINPLDREHPLRDVPAGGITPYKIVAGLRWNDRANRLWWEYSARSQTHVHRVSPLLRQSPLLQAADLWGLLGFTVHTVRGGINLVDRDNSRVSLTLAVENLGNKFYREQFQFAPARGRSFTIGLNLKYF